MEHKTGSCLCNSVTIEAPQMKSQFGACHCETCRKWTSGPFLAVDCGPDVKIIDEHVYWWHLMSLVLFLLPDHYGL